MYFAHKRVETGPYCTHEIPNIPKYHMLLTMNAWYSSI